MIDKSPFLKFYLSNNSFGSKTYNMYSFLIDIYNLLLNKVLYFDNNLNICINIKSNYKVSGSQQKTIFYIATFKKKQKLKVLCKKLEFEKKLLFDKLEHEIDEMGIEYDNKARFLGVFKKRTYLIDCPNIPCECNDFSDYLFLSFIQAMAIPKVEVDISQSEIDEMKKTAINKNLIKDIDPQYLIIEEFLKII